jgi:pimeloyl-ACP methyl ester carboxylesterase
MTSGELTTSDGSRLSYDRRGTGPPVLLLHGFGTHRGVWDQVLAELPGGAVTTVAVDLRGHGASTPMATPTGIEVLADDLAATIAALELRDVVIAGHSLGGMVVQAFCAQHPGLLSQVRGLLLVNTSVNPLASRATRAVGRYFQTRWPDRVHSSPRLSQAFARLSFPSTVPATTVRALAQIAPPPLSSRRSFVIATVPDFATTNAVVEVEVTVLASAKDLAISRRASAALAHSFPHAQLRMVPGTGHVLPLERPAIVAEELLRLVPGNTRTST